MLCMTLYSYILIECSSLNLNLSPVCTLTANNTYSLMSFYIYTECFHVCSVTKVYMVYCMGLFLPLAQVGAVNENRFSINKPGLTKIKKILIYCETCKTAFFISVAVVVLYYISIIQQINYNFH